MFSFRNKKPAPPLAPSNPGIGAEARVAFASGGRSWTEHVNVVRLAATVLQQRGYRVSNEGTWLGHADSGFLLVPQFVAVQPLEDGGVHTVTTMQSHHPALVPDGLFEYQHSTGTSVAEAISAGFNQWVQMDFVVLLDALRSRPQTCMLLELELPVREGRPARKRRAVLGPVSHFQEHPPQPSAGADPEEHPFCQCCLLTRTFEAFRELLEGEGFHGLRFFAARDADGQPQADCRVNGEDWEPGARALRAYAATWRPAGYEFRKQYVVFQTATDKA
jgi:hypothetical protein